MQKTLGSYRIRNTTISLGSIDGVRIQTVIWDIDNQNLSRLFSHNLRNYDAHLLMSELGKFKDHIISVIATTLEKFITFRLKKPDSPVQLIFLDSFQFPPTSLEKLVGNLQADQFLVLKEHFPSNTHLNLLRR